MMADKLKEVLRAKPFRRFRIHLADGRRVTVAHPELALMTPDNRTAIVIWPQSKLNIIELHSVTRITRDRRLPKRRPG
jgi:hypothetical protein